MLKLLFIGDIVGRPGRQIIADRLPRLRAERAIDFVIANGENAAAGAGITAALAKSILDSKVDAITLGDHVWDQRGWENEITQIEKVCRPANLPKQCPGWDHLIIEARGFRVAVFTVLGRSFMNMKADCPFEAADRLVGQLKSQADAIIVEIHAEATSEKQALARYLDGRVAAVVGTHTHVQTADERVLPGGTAAITDLGLTGGLGGVIGMKAEISIDRQLRVARGERMQPADTELCLQGAVVEIDAASGLARSIERISVAYEQVLENAFKR